MGRIGNGILGNGWPGFFGGLDGGLDGSWWGKHGRGDRKIAVITAVRAVAASGDGIFDNDWW